MKSLTMFSQTSVRLAGIALVAGALALATAMPAEAAGKADKPTSYEWTFSGPFGTFDRGQLQRGYQVYKEVCAACHAMSKIAFRNLSQPGGPGFSEDQVKALAAEFEIEDGPDENGETFFRTAVASDRFPSPFPNQQAARAAMGGAYPPDLSVMAKARKNGPNYLKSLLTGYLDEPPEGFELGDGMYYNKYFPGHQIAMAPPLYDEGIEYTDGTAMTADQYAKDVTAFMMWAAEPALEQRKQMGLQVMIFMLIFAALLYLSKQRLWRNIEH
ncbi:MAG: cytochrome c1 [Pseudomonadota bacterium]